MECEFCKKKLSNKSTLSIHQTTTKYCLKIQGKIKIEASTKVFECSFCNKVFNFKHHLNQHIPCCKNISIEKNKENKLLKEELIKKEILLSAYKEQLQKQEAQISELQKTIERMGTKAIEKPTTTNNNTTTNNTKINLVPFDLTNEYVSNIITGNFNDVHILEGVHGLAKFVKDKIITLEDGTLVYRCFDTSRQIFKYQDKNGNIVKDPKALKLIELIQPALKEQTNTLYDFFNDEINNYKKEEDEKRNEFLTTKDKMIFLKENTIKIQDEIADMHMNSRFCNELSAMTS